MSFTLDAFLIYQVEDGFTLDAWILQAHPTHDRVLYHTGQELTTNVVLDAAVGGYPARMPVQDVIAALYDRLLALEGANHHVSNFALDAVVLGTGAVIDGGGGVMLGAYSLDAVVQGPVALDFTLDAVLTAGGGFTLDAVIEAEQLGFTLDAWVI